MDKIKNHPFVQRHERPLAIISAILCLALIASLLVTVIAVGSNTTKLTLPSNRDKEATATNGEVVLNGGSDDGSQTGGSDSTAITNGEDDDVPDSTSSGDQSEDGGESDPEQPAPIIKPEDCIAPYFYIKATGDCQLCELTQRSGYIKESQSCNACPDNLFYDAANQNCFPCSGEQMFTQNEQCLFCPQWQINKGANKCVDRCGAGQRWAGDECKDKSKYLNLCRYSGVAFSKAVPKNSPFEDQCDHPCHKLEISMHLGSDQGGNPYFPRAVTCIGGNGEAKSHGKVTDESTLGTVGWDGACIYRVERQGTSQNITAVRYYWHRGSTYGADTFGNYLHGSSADTESFNGCLHGLFGNLQTDDSQEMDLGFRFSYPAPFRCATDDASSSNTCKCQGSVSFGPYYGHDVSRGALSPAQMKNWYPRYATIASAGSVSCTAATFDHTKEKDELYQCFCEES